MARELVNLSTENEQLQEKVKEFPEFEAKYKVISAVFSEDCRFVEHLRLTIVGKIWESCVSVTGDK